MARTSSGNWCPATQIKGYLDAGHTLLAVTLDLSAPASIAAGTTGNVTVTATLSDNLQHVPGGGAQISSIGSVGVVATDTDGDTTTGTVNINVQDDIPAVAPITVAGEPVDSNILLILDCSGSMDDPSGVPGFATRLDLLKAAANDLLDRYDAVGDVRVQIIEFNNDAQKLSSIWVSVEAAKTLINGLTAANGTDYDNATALAPDAFDDPGKLATEGARNIAYFISDGQPQPESGAVTGSELTDWITFVNANDIVSHAIGLGPSAPDTFLDPIAYDGRGSGTDTEALIVTELNQLQATLAGTINPPATGAIIDASIPTSFGADGGHIQSIAVGGQSFAYNTATDSIDASGSGGATSTFDQASNQLTIGLGDDESFVIDLDDGTYVYTPSTSITPDFTRVFTYTLVDNDGDTVASTLTIGFGDASDTPLTDASRSPLMAVAGEDGSAGSGIDTFVIDPAALTNTDLVDLIADYTPGEDQMDLSALLASFGMNAPDTEAEASAAVDVAFSDGAAHVLVDADGVGGNSVKVDLASLAGVGAGAVISILYDQDHPASTEAVI